MSATYPGARPSQTLRADLAAAGSSRRRSRPARRSLVAAGVDPARAERRCRAGGFVEHVAVDAARVVREQVDRDRRRGGRGRHAVDVVLGREQRVPVARLERPAADALEAAVLLPEELLVLVAAIEPDQAP